MGFLNCLGKSSTFIFDWMTRKKRFFCLGFCFRVEVASDTNQCCGYASPWCGSGCGSGSDFSSFPPDADQDPDPDPSLRKGGSGSRLLKWCGSLRIRIHNTDTNPIHSLNVTPVVFPLGGGQRGGEQEFAGGGKRERAAEQQAGGDSGAGTSGPPSPPLQVSYRKTSFKETVLDE